MAHSNEAFSVLDQIRSNITPYTYFPSEETREAYVAAVGSGMHIMLEAVPGVGKTTLAKAMSRSLNVDFSRIQGSPDMKPVHILGQYDFNPVTGERGAFMRGLIFGNIVLADEFNRTPGPTQAAFMEAMEEGAVTTTRGEKIELPKPFLVIGTQNPHDQSEGTNEVPAANLDRFGVSFSFDKPYEENDAKRINRIDDMWAETGGPSAVADVDDWIRAREAIVNIKKNMDDDRVRHAQFLVSAIRSHGGVDTKESLLNGFRATRAALYLGSAICALRDQVTLEEEHINLAMPHVIRHRLSLTFSEMKNGTTRDDIINEIITQYS